MMDSIQYLRSMLAAAQTISQPHPAMILPFVLMLLSIAVLPLINKQWWDSHFPKVAVGLAIAPTVYYVFFLNEGVRILHVAHEYLSFIILIGALYVVSGGILIRVKGEARPLANCGFLFVGAVLANLMGTTGASMLLIRPWIRMNKYRITAFHIVFFVFIIGNVGGCLTPIGDPPLFLGFIKGVPFAWVIQRCWSAWAVSVIGLIGVFYLFDRANFLRAPREIREAETRDKRWQIDGLPNLAFLALILVAVFLRTPAGLSELLMVAAAIGSWLCTPRPLHEANDFNFEPIREVAWLFAGIFATMAPALDFLEGHAGNLGLDSEAKLFWLTGALSAVLDNAPTYLTFLAAAFGNHHLSLTHPGDVLQFVAQHDRSLLAISLGAVFFGAMTYIGNGPNFLVKSISEKAKVNMPSFSEYFFRFALPILVPLFGLITLLFFSR